MLEFILKYKLSFIGVALGSIAGFAYYYFVGCSSGTCAITSKPFNSTAYGALMGFILFTNFDKRKNEKDHESI
jgi:uncharacterized membrane protein YdjX (TVP38/TMEM64 family)